MKKIFKFIGIVLGIIIVALLLLVGYWYFRPNRAQVNPAVVLETWDIARDGTHNSNTDMIEWNGQFYIAYVSSPFHFGNDKSVMKVERSSDKGRTWEEVERYNPPGEDIRDPKFAVFGNRLFLYALKNTNFIAEPYLSVYAYSENGSNWTDFQTVPNLDGWLFWRPKTQDGKTFYNTAYWWEHGKSILLKSTDGIQWETISTVHEGGRNDETEIEFLPDGRLISTARLEYGVGSEAIFGDPKGSTLIAVSSPPFTTWKPLIESLVTRLDGPYLFPYNGRVYAIGRYQPDPGKTGPLSDQGSCLAKKRTSIFEVRENGLAYLTDLPSAGDTSYVGLIREGDTVYASYYTSRVDRDYAWLLGMLSPSTVKMAKIDLQAMETLADSVAAK
jgi:hypothetical protein